MQHALQIALSLFLPIFLLCRLYLAFLPAFQYLRCYLMWFNLVYLTVTISWRFLSISAFFNLLDTDLWTVVVTDRWQIWVTLWSGRLLHNFDLRLEMDHLSKVILLHGFNRIFGTHYIFNVNELLWFNWRFWTFFPGLLICNSKPDGAILTAICWLLNRFHQSLHAKLFTIQFLFTFNHEISQAVWGGNFARSTAHLSTLVVQ